MKTMSKRACLLASSFITTAALAAALGAPASAQAPAAAGGNAGEVSAIVVTGTRIPQTTNLQSISPVQTTTAQEFQLQGKTNTIEVINNLPQVSINSTTDLSSTSNPLSGPGGVATIDLRGLGPQRTLVLVNGRRLGIGDPNTGNPNPAPDINQIPAQLIDRVDVLTGGSSAVYGSDAVAGVVNFIMKQNFSGVQVDAQYGTYNHTNDNEFVHGLLQAFPGGGIPVPKRHVWDGQSKDLSFMMGLNTADGRGNVTLYATYRDQDPVSFSRRDFASCQIRIVGTSITCNGSVNSNQFLSADGTFSGTFAVQGNQFIPFSNNNLTSPPPRFNSNPFEYLQHQDTRYTAGMFAHYELDPHATIYSEFAFMNDRATTQVAPAGLFEGTGATENSGFLINCNNPFLSAQQQGVLHCTAADIASGSTRDLLIGRRNIEGGPRQSHYEHQNYRIVLGLRGDISGPWKYDVYGSRYYTSLYQLNSGYTSVARTQQALLATRTPAGPACTVTTGGCVPYNIFQTGGVSSAQTAFLAENGSEYGTTTESIVEGTITGDLTSYGLKSPYANDGAGVALGANYRKDTLVFAPDAAVLSGDLSGFGGAGVAIDNSLSVKEVYGELRLPLVQGRSFMDDLSLEGGYRYSDYSTGISANTFKIGGDWAPVSDIRFRASFQRAIRAPNILELYNPQSVTNTSVVSVDPCAPNEGAPASATLAQCQRTGVTAAQYGNGGSTNAIPQCPAGQCAILQGGSTTLRPETANTFSVGFTFRPTFLRGLIASVDYYHIKIEDIIGTIPVDLALSNCISTGAPTFCNLVHRAPNGILFGTTIGGGYLVNTSVNVAQETNSGIDGQITYNMPLSTFGLETMGSLSFDLTGTYLLSQKNIPLPGEHEYDCAGYFGTTCGTVNPKWRHNLRTTWNTPWNVLASIGWRHISGVTYEGNSTDPSLTAGTIDTTFQGHLKSKDYIDLTAIWKVNRMLSFRAGVTNLFDVDPPIVSYLISGTGAANTYPTYDQLGRRIFVGLTANF